MSRVVLTDEIWGQLQEIMKPKGCKSSANNRNVMKLFYGRFTPVQHGVMCLQVYARGDRLQSIQQMGSKGIWDNFFCSTKKADTEWIFIDGSYVRVHQHASGSRRGEHRAIGTSRGGPSRKIHIAVDAHGNPLYIEITGGKSTTVKRRQL